MRPVWLMIGWLIVATVSVNAETHTIKLKKERPAKKLVHTEDTTESDVKVTDQGNNAINQEQSKEKLKVEYTETVVEREGGTEKKLERAYKTAEKTIGKERKPLAFHGRTVILEKKGKTWEARAKEAPELPEADRKKLAREMVDNENLDLIFVPEQPVKVGASWTVSRKALEAWGALGKLDFDRSKGQAKLVKVYRKDGKSWGVIEVKLQLALKSVQELTFDPPGTVDLQGTLDAVIDGSSIDGKLTSNLKVEGKGTIKIDDQTLKFTMASKTNGTEERREQPAR
jgi:hypothetical protein